jgi:hypothetical protein
LGTEHIVRHWTLDSEPPGWVTLPRVYPRLTYRAFRRSTCSWREIDTIRCEEAGVDPRPNEWWLEEEVVGGYAALWLQQCPGLTRSRT